MIYFSVIFRFTIALFAVDLLVTSMIFLVGEFVMGINYMVESMLLLAFIYLLELVKSMAQIAIIVSIIFCKYKVVVFYISTASFLLCLIHLLYIFCAVDVLVVDDVLMYMKIDSEKNIIFLAVYFYFVRAFCKVGSVKG